jgi:hypothetical protein
MAHGSHHKRRSASKAAARVVLVLAAVIFGGAIFHFSYTAYESGQCFTTDADSISTETRPRRPIDSGDCRSIIASSENHQRSDAAIALLAVVLMIGAGVRLSKASRRTRRLVLVAEIAVVTLGVVYTVLLATALR